MALILADRVKANTTTTGTGTVVLSATAPTGYQPFAVIGDGNTTYYTIAGQTTSEWEVGIGTYYAANTSLSRTTILASSAANAAVTFSAGTKDVFVTYPAETSVYANGTVITAPTGAALPVVSGGTGVTAASITAFNNITGYAATGNTGATTSNLVFSSGPTFSGITATGQLSFNGSTTSNIVLGNSQTSGLLTIGSVTQTGTMTVGQSNATQTTNIQTGATVAAATKTINIGTNGLVNSFTNITIGSANGTTTAVYGNLNVDTATFFVDAVNNRVGIGTATPASLLTVTGQIESTSTGYKFPDGTTQTTAATAGLPAAGNNSIGIFNTNITTNATINAGTNGFSVGPVVTANNVTVTVASGQTWTII